jgi:hypothetical protein
MLTRHFVSRFFSPPPCCVARRAAESALLRSVLVVDPTAPLTKPRLSWCAASVGRTGVRRKKRTSAALTQPRLPIVSSLLRRQVQPVRHHLGALRLVRAGCAAGLHVRASPAAAHAQNMPHTGC